jgi:hypothetical protein
MFDMKKKNTYRYFKVLRIVIRSRVTFDFEFAALNAFEIDLAALCAFKIGFAVSCTFEIEFAVSCASTEMFFLEDERLID